jgi:molybdate transport system permease protein
MMSWTLRQSRLQPRAGATYGRLRSERVFLASLGGLLVAFLMMPIVALVATATISEFGAGIRNHLVWPALRLSLVTTSSTLVVVLLLGTPLAWSMARARSRLAHLVETAVQLPIVIPPAVAGVAMLLAFGRRGLFAGWLYPRGWSISFTTPAVVVAETFVSAPFFLQAATSAFQGIDERLIVVAESLGASPLRVFLRIGLPLAAPGLVAGAAMSWARSLGEFGATLMFAGNLQGVTQTLPLAIYTTIESDMRAAQALSVVLLVVAFALLVFVRAVVRSSKEAEGRFP